MKKMMRLAVGMIAALSLASCGGEKNTGNTGDTGNTVAKTATMTAAFTSPAKMNYMNARPNYNYYTTTFAFQTLELYSDNTAVFTISCSTFSAVILPEDGSAATANERNNYLVKFYAPFTSKVDSDLDEDAVDYTLSAPTRMVLEYDSMYYVDTDNWTENMKNKAVDKKTEYDAATGQSKVTGETKYETGAEYLAAHKYKGDITFHSSIQNCSIEYNSDIKFDISLGSAM